MKMGILITTNDTETVWNAFRFANFAYSKKDIVKVFLLGKGVEAEEAGTEKFDVKKQMEKFIGTGGQILARETCLKIWNANDLNLCSVSTLADLYEMINKSDKIISF